MKILGKIFCLLGFHTWEKEPSKKSIIRGTGTHFVFFSEGIQNGVQLCEREGCFSERKVYRKGWIGVGGTATQKWKKLNSSMETYIQSLPEGV